MNGRMLVAGLVAIVALAVGVSLATAAKQKPRNGNFEAGSLSRWHVTDLDSDPEDTWYVYSGTSTPLNDFDFPAPPQGEFAAVTDQGGEGTHILHRTRKLRAGYTHKLSMWVYYDSQEEIVSPDTLDSDAGPNQQYRIDVLKRGAPIDSVEESDVLMEVFGTESGDPTNMEPTKVSANLTRFAGKRVVLRFAEVDNQLFFNAGVDAVKLKSKPKK